MKKFNSDLARLEYQRQVKLADLNQWEKTGRKYLLENKPAKNNHEENRAWNWKTKSPKIGEPVNSAWF